MSRLCGADSRPILPATITANGITRRLTAHARDRATEEVTAESIKYVLENWIIRGICEDSAGSITTTYWGIVPGQNRFMRVAVSLDDERIVTAHSDGKVARRLNQEGRLWFESRCRHLEVRDAR